MSRLWYLVLIGILFFPGLVSAAVDTVDDNDTITLDEVVVSVTKTETTEDKIGGNSITVIRAEDLELKKQTSVSEVLKSVPGLDIVGNGGPGTTTSVFLRGADSKNTLVLIDGVMFNNTSQANRGANLANMTLDNIERIEVVRGPMSVMYGSNATAGVINIITKSGRRHPSTYAGAEAGSYNTYRVYTGTSGGTRKFDYSLSGARLQSDGYSIANDANENIPHDGNTDENDGYLNSTVSGKFSFDVTGDFKISAVARYINSESDLDDYAGGYTGDNIGSTWAFDPVTGTWVETSVANPDDPTLRKIESDQFFSKFTIDNGFFDRFFESTFSYQLSRQKNQSYDNYGADTYDYNGEYDELAWQGDLNFNTNTLSFGANYLAERMVSESSGVGRQNVYTLSSWGQDQAFITDNLVLIAGVRLDDHEEFGSKATYRLSSSYNISKTGTLLKASYGTGFRAPSLFELYSSYGNSDLEPEESTGWDLGVEQSLLARKVKLGLTYFNTLYDNRIDYDMAIMGYNQLDGETKTNGVEAFIGWSPIPELGFNLDYTYTNTVDPDNSRLVRRPYNKLHLNSTYRFLEDWQVNVDVYWVDERKASEYSRDSDGNVVEVLDAYTLVNVSAVYDFNEYLQLYGRIDNLFNEFYEEAWSYATPGLSAYIGFKVHFDKAADI